MPAALTIALAGAIAVAAYAGDVFLVLIVLGVQGLLLSGWYRVLDVPGAIGGMVLAGATAVAADVLLLVRDEVRPLKPVVGVLGLAMLGALVHQLTRRPDRTRVTASLTATCTQVVLVALGSLYLAANETRGGAALVSAVALAAAAAAAAELLPFASGFRVAIGVVGGAVVGAVVGATTHLAIGSALLAGVSASVVAVAATGFVRRAGRPDLPVAAALPLLVAAPVSYVVGRILVG
jgi:hypothetical protein